MQYTSFAMGESNPPPASQQITNGALFEAFLKVGVSGFGGVMPFARRMLVEQQRWLTPHEFTEVLSLSQFLPGPNIVNMSVIVGRRFQGPSGAAAATFGLLLLPLIIVLVLATVYSQFATIDAVRNACNGVSASASGLVLAMAVKMALPIRRTPWQICVCAIAFVAIAIARWPLPWVLAVLVPVSTFIAWRGK